MSRLIKGFHFVINVKCQMSSGRPIKMEGPDCAVMCNLIYINASRIE